MGKMTDIDELMYSCGLEILHPDGIEKTDEMARVCKIGKDKKVSGIGSGKGVTACYLAQKYECEVVGVDLSERMVEYAKEMAKKNIALPIEYAIPKVHRYLTSESVRDDILSWHRCNYCYDID